MQQQHPEAHRSSQRAAFADGGLSRLCDDAWMDSGPDHANQRDAATASRRGRPRAGQVALVTGGSAGLGLAIAAALADAGSDVVLASRSESRCKHAAAGLSAQTGSMGRRRGLGRGEHVT